MKTLFGPVPSRRFGRSLGIDLFSTKTCTFNCIYCEVGESDPVLKQSGQVPAGEVVGEVSDYLISNTDNPPDFITFAGSGEPTLHPGIGRMIAGIHGITTIPVVLLTNGSLLHRKVVRDRVLEVDYLVPSLDAGCEEDFHRINRPVSAIHYSDLIRGLKETRALYTGHYLLEVLLVDGVNTSQRELELLRDRIREIGPDGVQVNTVFRPPADGHSRAADDTVIQQFVDMVGPIAKPVRYYQQRDGSHHLKGRLLDEVILKTVRIRPCTIAELTNSLSVPKQVMGRALSGLKDAGRLGEQRHGDEIFLVIPQSDPD